MTKAAIESNRSKTAREFAKKYNCTLLLKGRHTVVAAARGQSPKGGYSLYINKTGNAGMATAGSGDVLTGIITAFLAQGLNGYDAAKFGAYIHGKAGHLAAQKFTKVSLIASDLIDFLPKALKTK